MSRQRRDCDPPGGTEFELSTPDDYTILGVVISEDVISRQAQFLHNPERVLHMLRNQSALEVKEQHKAALWGFVQQALATFSENPENLHQPAVRKVLGDNLLLAMGMMLEDAHPINSAESISHQGYRKLLSRAREYVLENMSEPRSGTRPLPTSFTSAVVRCRMHFTPFWGLDRMRG